MPALVPDLPALPFLPSLLLLLSTPCQGTVHHTNRKQQQATLANQVSSKQEKEIKHLKKEEISFALFHVLFYKSKPI